MKRALILIPAVFLSQASIAAPISGFNSKTFVVQCAPDQPATRLTLSENPSDALTCATERNGYTPLTISRPMTVQIGSAEPYKAGYAGVASMGLGCNDNVIELEIRNSLKRYKLFIWREGKISVRELSNIQKCEGQTAD